ncbi:MAG: tetraacyldisaccharide 4'-kinase [Magnetococcus sp. MYC-9]
MRRLTELLEGRRLPDNRAVQAGLTLLGGIGRLYGGIMGLRAELYHRRILPSYRAPCPVISVGNLSAGGTGKTPMVLWLARQLAPWQAGLAIVSRGYGASAPPDDEHPGITQVADANGPRLGPAEAGDEALLLAHNLPGVTILTGADRARLIRHAVDCCGSRLILMDDGFQHLRVQRDLNVLLMDARQPLGNGALLPGGILRESPQAMRRADVIILTRCESPELFAQARQRLTPHAPQTPFLHAEHRPTAWLRLGETAPLPLSALQRVPVLAFCGIARPDSFAQTLARLQVHTTGLVTLTDHAAFGRPVMARLIRQARARQAQAMVCTEKDAVKILPVWLEAEPPHLPLYVLRMAIHFPEPPLWLQQRLASLVDTPLNSPTVAPHQSA